MAVNRALAVLTVGALLTIVLGVAGSGDPVASLLLGIAFAVLATAGFVRVRARDRRAWSVGYVALALPLAVATFVTDPSVGATLFLVVLVSQCVLLLPLPAVAVVIAVVPFVHVGMSWAEGLREAFGTLVAVLFAAVVTELLQREQRTRRELATAHEQLRDHAARAERLATAQERNRVARDIHDGLGHSLTVVQMQVKAARAVLGTDPERADDVLAQAQDQSEAALAEVRRSVRALREPRPVPPLPEALTALAQETSATGVPTALAVSGPERDLPDETREALFRTAQEGLTNVRRHAGAGRADLVLEFAEAGVRLEVRDDGAGMTEPSEPGFGLVGIRERAARLGGRLDVESGPGQGCTLRVEIPT